MVAIKKQLIKSTKPSFGKGNGKKFITIHETANTTRGATAQMHANLQSNGNSRAAAWHYQVDDKHAIQSFTHAWQLWNAGDGSGDGNMNGISIEICVNSDGNFKKAVKNAAELTKKIMKQEGISKANVVQHNHWSGKNCPTQLRSGSKGVTWADLMAMIDDSDGSSKRKKSKKDTTKSGKKPSKWTKKKGKWTGQTLRKGQHGKPVKQLQKKLATHKPPYYPNSGAKNNGVDGYFGAKTKNAVERFQMMEGLNVDGMAGKKTYKRLTGKTAGNSKSKGVEGGKLPKGIIRRGARGKKVRIIQQTLADHKPPFYPDKGATNNGVDGVYGAKTANAVKRFQSTVGLPQDGIYGPKTRNKLQ